MTRPPDFCAHWLPQQNVMSVAKLGNFDNGETLLDVDGRSKCGGLYITPP